MSSPSIETRHHLPLSTLQPWLVKKLEETEFPNHQKGWNELKKIKQFSFGQSNPTYLFEDTSNNQLVLRSRPSGRLISPTAHNLQREHLILSSLNAYNQFLLSHTSSLDSSSDGEKVEDWLVPIPRVYGYYAGDEKSEEKAIGMPEFYLMEFKEGEVFEDVEMPDLKDDRERAECWRLSIRTLSILSTLPLPLLDLPNTFGPPPHLPIPFYSRQVRALLKVSGAQAKTPIPSEKGFQRSTVGPIEGERKMVPYLISGAEHLGEKEKREKVWGLVHGDYKIDNMIFKKRAGRWAVVGVLDWELCTLGSPLSDLANLLLPYSIDSETVPSAFRPASISLSRFPGRTSPPETKPGETPPPNLLKGLKNIPADVLVVPQASDLEKYWVECMHRGEIWRTKVLDVWRRENQGTGAKVLSELEKQMGREDERTSRWAYPVKGLNWVRSWMIWRLAIISQGISARASLGQASSAFATPDNVFFDTFGRLAGKCREVDLAGRKAEGWVQQEHVIEGRESKL